MPASMITAWVALSPKVTGKRMLMPESGPMPGSTPTKVPTRQPRKAYQRLSGCRATEKPCSRLTRVVPTLESQRPGRERCLQAPRERAIGQHGHRDAVERGHENVLPLDDDEQTEQQQGDRRDEAEPRIGIDGDARDDDDKAGVLEIIPVDSGKRPRFRRPQNEDAAEGNQQRRQE